MATTQQFEILIDNAPQATTYATRDEAEKAANALRSGPQGQGKTVTVREKVGQVGHQGGSQR